MCERVMMKYSTIQSIRAQLRGDHQMDPYQCCYGCVAFLQKLLIMFYLSLFYTCFCESELNCMKKKMLSKKKWSPT